MRPRFRSGRGGAGPPVALDCPSRSPSRGGTNQTPPTEKRLSSLGFGLEGAVGAQKERSGPFLFKGRAGAGLPGLFPEAAPIPGQTRTQ